MGINTPSRDETLFSLTRPFGLCFLTLSRSRSAHTLIALQPESPFRSARVCESVSPGSCLSYSHTPAPSPSPHSFLSLPTPLSNRRTLTSTFIFAPLHNLFSYFSLPTTYIPQPPTLLQIPLAQLHFASQPPLLRLAFSPSDCIYLPAVALR